MVYHPVVVKGIDASNALTDIGIELSNWHRQGEAEKRERKPREIQMLHFFVSIEGQTFVSAYRIHGPRCSS
jgi:hypothetical protein